jgi:hypothetical protein
MNNVHLSPWHISREPSSSNSFMSSGDLNTMALSQGKVQVPREIDVHLKIFGKEPWEVDYGLHGYCDMCNSRIDEFGYCACGGSAD